MACGLGGVIGESVLRFGLVGEFSRYLRKLQLQRPRTNIHKFTQY